MTPQELSKAYKALKKKHDEVSRALSGDQTRLERLGDVLDHTKEQIEKEQEFRLQIEKEIELLNNDKNIAEEEKEITKEQLSKVVNTIDEATKVLEETEKEIEIIKSSKSNAENEAIQTLKDLEVIKEKSIEFIGKDIKDKKYEVSNLNEKKENLEFTIKSLSDFTDQIKLDLDNSKKELELNEKKKVEIDSELEKQKSIKRETKIMQQKLLEEQLRLKELRRNKDK